MDWGNFGATILGSILTLLGGFIQQKYSEKQTIELKNNEVKMEKLEKIRQEKITIIKDIAGNKTAIADKYADHNTATAFNAALNLIPVIFQDNEKIIAKHKELYEDVVVNGDKANDTFYELIVLLYEDVDFVPPSREQHTKTFIV